MNPQTIILTSALLLTRLIAAVFSLGLVL